MNKLLKISNEYAGKMSDLKERELRQKVLESIMETHKTLKKDSNKEYNYALAYGELIGKLSIQFHLFKELRKYGIIGE